MLQLLKWVTGGYRTLEQVTGNYKGLLEVTGITGVTRGYRDF